MILIVIIIIFGDHGGSSTISLGMYDLFSFLLLVDSSFNALNDYYVLPCTI